MRPHSNVDFGAWRLITACVQVLGVPNTSRMARSAKCTTHPRRLLCARSSVRRPHVAGKTLAHERGTIADRPVDFVHCRYSPLGHAGPATVVERLQNVMVHGGVPGDNSRSNFMLRQFLLFVAVAVMLHLWTSPEWLLALT